MFSFSRRLRASCALQIAGGNGDRLLRVYYIIRRLSDGSARAPGWLRETDDTRLCILHKKKLIAVVVASVAVDVVGGYMITYQISAVSSASSRAPAVVVARTSSEK